MSPSGASDDAAAVEDEETNEDGEAAAVEEEQDAVMCDVWPNADGGSTAGHGFSTSQEVSDCGVASMS